MSEIYKAIIAVQSKIEDVKRDTKGQVGNQQYKYATLDAVLEMLRPLLAENGLAVLQIPDGAGLKTKLIHRSGEALDCGEYLIGAHEKQQAIGSAITYGRRYSLCAIFGISQVDDDGAEASKDKPPAFANAALRKKWCDGLFLLFEEALTLEELEDALAPNKAMIEKMKNGSEHDVLAVEEVRQRFQRNKKRLQDEAARMQMMKEQLNESQPE